MLHFASRLQNVETSAIRELFKLLGKPGIISFAGGFPDPALFDVYLTPSQAVLAKYLWNPSDYYPSQIPGYTPYRIGKKRGNPLRNDSYFSSTFRLTWKIGDVYADWFKNKRSMRCPQYF